MVNSVQGMKCEIERPLAPVVAQLVERQTVEKRLSVGRWFDSASPEFLNLGFGNVCITVCNGLYV